MRKVGIIGLGYVGLSTAVCFAKNAQVTGIDVDEGKVDSLRSGSTIIHEKGLQKLLRSGLRSGRLAFTTDYQALKGAEYFFLTIGTPSSESGGIDLSQVSSATTDLAPVIAKSRGYPLVVTKSTVVPGTTRGLVKKTLEDLSGKKAGVDFGVCANPEFLREGSAVQDTLNPDRIVVGCEESRSARALTGFYKSIYASLPPIVRTDPDTAELIKYACNAFLATKVSFINMVSWICENLPNSSVDEVARSMGLDPRIGARFLEAGPGFGGSCFPKDLKALIDYAEKVGVDVSLLRAVDQINETQPGHVASIARRALGDLTGKTVAILGAAFKEGTDDVRESRALRLAEILIREGVQVRICDPLALEGARRALGDGAVYCESARECIKGADLAVVMNAESEFRALRPRDFLKLMRHPSVLDTRRIYEARDFDSRVPISYVGRSWHP